MVEEILSYITFGISVFAAVMSVIALRNTGKLWRLTNRPVVIVSVQTFSAGNQGSSLKLVVKNVGNRAAKNIQLSANPSDLDRLLIPGDVSDRVRRCFAGYIVPVLAAGDFSEAGFGFLAVGTPQSSWRAEALLEVTVRYNDVILHTPFEEKMNIQIADNRSFTRSMWVSEEQK